jgi:hypothetical protein
LLVVVVVVVVVAVAAAVVFFQPLLLFSFVADVVCEDVCDCGCSCCGGGEKNDDDSVGTEEYCREEDEPEERLAKLDSVSHDDDEALPAPAAP